MFHYTLIFLIGCLEVIKISKEKKEKPKEKIKANPLIDKIVDDYPKDIVCHPRDSFESQLRRHLLKHGVK